MQESSTKTVGEEYTKGHSVKERILRDLIGSGPRFLLRPQYPGMNVSLVQSLLDCRDFEIRIGFKDTTTKNGGPYVPSEKCKACNGTGNQARIPPMESRGPELFGEKWICGICNGLGFTSGRPGG